jgi:hypothetical protein
MSARTCYSHCKPRKRIYTVERKNIFYISLLIHTTESNTLVHTCLENVQIIHSVYLSECTGFPIGIVWFRMIFCSRRSGAGEILYCRSLGLDVGFELIIEFIGYLLPLTTDNYDTFIVLHDLQIATALSKSLYSFMSLYSLLVYSLQ